MREDGTNVVLEDLASRTRWHLDESTRFVAKGVSRFDHEAYACEEVARKQSRVALVGKGSATKVGVNAIRNIHRAPAGTLSLRFVMEKDRLRVVAEAEGTQGVTALALPGTFRPDNGGFLSALPSCQGVLHTGKGPGFYKPLFGKGHHDGFTMSMFGQITDRAGLMVVAESDADAALHWEKTSAGEVRLLWLQHPSMGTLSYDREVVIFPAENSVTSICKCYRRYVIERGRFRNWEEKLAQRPALEKLFGAAIAFLGYFQDHECDYASSLRRLKQMGIDKAVVYPMWCQSTCDTKAVMNADSTDTRAHATLAAQPDTVTLDSAKRDPGLIHVENAPHVTLRGLRIVYFQRTGVSAYRAPFTTVDRCVFWNGPGWVVGNAVFCFYSPHCTIARTLAVGAEGGFCSFTRRTRQSQTTPVRKGCTPPARSPGARKAAL